MNATLLEELRRSATLVLILCPNASSNEDTSQTSGSDSDVRPRYVRCYPDRMPTRREFCQALTIISAASLAAACSGNSASGSDAPQLTTVNGTFNGATVTVNVDASSP